MRGSTPPNLTPEELAAVGHTLYGAAWRAELACALGAPESEIVKVEAGQAIAPAEWRGKLITLANDFAHRAMDAASNLLWGLASVPAPEEQPALYAPQPMRLA